MYEKCSRWNIIAAVDEKVNFKNLLVLVHGEFACYTADKIDD